MRVWCPRCGRPGTLKVKIVGRYRYLVIDHGDTQHSLCNIEDTQLLDQVIQELVHAYEKQLKSWLAEKLSLRHG